MNYPIKYQTGIRRYKLYTIFQTIGDTFVKEGACYVYIDRINSKINGEKIQFGDENQIEILKDIKIQKAKGYRAKIPRVDYLKKGMVFKGRHWFGIIKKTILEIDIKNDSIKLLYQFLDGSSYERTVKINTFIRWTLDPSACILEGGMEFKYFDDD